jgi:FKBP-type peptidyl-prolyl cis-trans isomerase
MFIRPFLSAVAILATLLLLNACKTNTKFEYKPDKDGISYAFFTDKSGSHVQSGDIITYNFYYRLRDSIVYRSNMRMPDVTVSVPDSAETSDNFLLRVITKMSAGDSVRIQLVVDSTKALRLPPQFKVGDTAHIDVALRKVRTQKEIKAERDKLLVGTKPLGKMGIVYKTHIQNNGAKPVPTGGAVYHLDLYKGNELKTTSRNVKEPAKRKILTPEEQAKYRDALNEMLASMSKGDSVSFFVPTDTIRRNIDPSWGFQPGDVARIDVVLIDIKTPEEVQLALAENTKKQEALAAELKQKEGTVTTLMAKMLKDHKANKINYTQTPSGLRYFVIEKGSGATPTAKQDVQVNYAGYLTDGKMFDSSFSHGQPFRFALGQGQVIKGWDEGVALLPVGTKALLSIPAALAYGAAGSPPSIPANADLLFYIELTDAQ